MSQRMIAETICDVCGRIEQRQQTTPFLPPAWRVVQTGYYGTNGLVPEQTKLLCDVCTARVGDAMDPVLQNVRAKDTA